MADNNYIKDSTSKFICPTYARYPLGVDRARGCFLYDFNGREYLDLLSGISVCNLGHSHPEVVSAIKKQADKLIHVSNLFYQREQVELAQALLETCAMDKVFFCNSGAEANEGAIKLLRRYMKNIKKQDRFELITMSGSFHGRTLATLTATGQDKIKQGFAPLPPGFKTVEFNQVDGLEKAITPNTAGIMLEIIQGEGGIRMVSELFLDEVIRVCNRHDLLLIVDEIQTGMGRTGQFWAHQHYGLKPDIMTSAKALAGGLPMGAVLARDEIAQAFDAGSHGTTFGGNPLACAAALKTLDIISRDGLVRHAAELGREALEIFSRLKAKHPKKINDVRGKGLMLGIELTFPGTGIWRALLEKGFVLNLTQDTVLRLLPPLIISKKQIQDFAKTLDQLLHDSQD
ncbi:aspartate aminotransferase family protein [Desulfonatronovibrio hydrogenovorans]|uniref:aspartate aminotransferase family protein n=1 Tax=Desulfonatronovibrio hydrogenovorans TaxID=53245 RepID=UPI0004901686|nr:aspartate aminotransferase family protein [Desulfonatronovibrio hydrogenovorans]